MDYILIGLFALFGSALTLFSGFGLGTILLPIFGLFFPIEIAVIMTSIVHLANNLLKVVLFGKNASKTTVLYFGIPAIIFAFIGAYCLTLLSNLNPLFTYRLFTLKIEISYVKATIGLLLIIFSLVEYLAKYKNLAFNKKYLPLGGVLSGFFGGLSGHQGALRSAFLIKIGLSKNSFIATGVLIACLVDLSRLSIYIPKISTLHNSLNFKLIIFATIAAFAGVYIGNKLLEKVTIQFVQNCVAFLLFTYGILLIIGLL